MTISEFNLKRRVTLLMAAALVAGPAWTQTLKIATVTPEGSSWMRDMRAAAAEISERTQGAVEVKFYGGGVQGDDIRVLRKIRGRQLQGAVMTSSALAEIYPEMLQYGLPLLFHSREEMLFVRERIDGLIADGLRDKGFESFGFGSLGFARIMTAEKPVVRLEDARGLKIWVPKGDDISFRAMRSVGLAPLELPVSDVLVSLQTGIVDMVVGPPSGAILLQWHTRLRYVTDFPVVFAYGLLAIDKRVFAGLSLENQDVVRDAFATLAGRLDRQDAADNAEASQALRNSGLEYIQPPSEEVAKWRLAFADIYPELVREAGMSPQLHERIMGLLAEFRSGQGTG